MKLLLLTAAILMSGCKREHWPIRKFAVGDCVTSQTNLERWEGPPSHIKRILEVGDHSYYANYTFYGRDGGDSSFDFDEEGRNEKTQCPCPKETECLKFRNGNEVCTGTP